jgi:catechol 2,3-dioxygenase-like lactoylglutathione lyase family enzyme
MKRVDVGWTHVALPAYDLPATIAFYEDVAGLRVMHDRTESDGHDGARVVWLGDGLRPFVLVLAQTSSPVVHPLGPFAHLGIALPSRAAVDAVVERARARGTLREGPNDSGPPVGYWCFVADPNGHMVEFSFGQEVGLTVEDASGA